MPQSPLTVRFAAFLQVLCFFIRKKLEAYALELKCCISNFNHFNYLLLFREQYVIIKITIFPKEASTMDNNYSKIQELRHSKADLQARLKFCPMTAHPKSKTVRVENIFMFASVWAAV